MNENNPYELLRARQIYAILDGDTSFGEYKVSETAVPIRIAMPYLSGPDLCDISTMFGLPETYFWKGMNRSRWEYLDRLLSHCIKTDRCSDLLAYLFDLKQFINTFSELRPPEVDDAYKIFFDSIIKGINDILSFNGHELSVVNRKFVIRGTADKVEILAPKIKNIDRDYIKSISARAEDDIQSSNYDSAITKSRTLLEEVFCYVIEKKGETPSSSGKISELYKQVKNLYHMHGDESTDRRINTLLSGLEKIITSISEMRNKDSDAHGVGASRIKIEEHHARLFVNSATTIADFILAVEVKSDAK